MIRQDSDSLYPHWQIVLLERYALPLLRLADKLHW